jgi:hypothetical protein
MHKRVGIVVLAAAVAGILIYPYARRHGGAIAPAADPPALVGLAPADSTVLFYADLAALRSSPFVMRLAALAPPVTKDPDYAEFVRATGFDYERDLDRVVLALQNELQHPITTALADGRFDQENIAAYASRIGKVEQRNGEGVYVIPTKSPGKTVAIRFLSANRIALTDGPKPWPASEAVSKTERRIHPFAPEMQERLARVNGAPLFAVAKLDAAMQKKNFLLGGLRSDQLENLARSVRWLSLAARPEADRLHLALEGECDTAEKARQLAGTLDGLRILARMGLGDPKTRRRLDPATLSLLEALLRGAEVSQENKGPWHRVRLTFVITQDSIHLTPK